MVDDRRHLVGALLDRGLRAGLATGCSALAWQDDGPGLAWLAGRRGFGLAEVDEETLFDLASLTKPLATTTLLLLAMRDGLELKTPLGELLDELRHGPWADVTVEQCACHTAGFPAWAPLYAGGTGAEAYLAELDRIAPGMPAGTRVEYSCLGFIAIGIALERAAGCGLAALFDELVAEPLGLADTIGFAPAETTPVAAGESDWFVERRLLAERGYAVEPPAGAPGRVPCDDGNARGLAGAAGNAGLFATTTAVVALAAEFLPGGGELLTASEVELAVAPRTAGMEQVRGLGWQLAATPGCSAGPALPPSAFGHVGFSGTSVWVAPGSRRVFGLLTNRLHPGGRMLDLHPMRRGFHTLATAALDVVQGEGV